MATPTHRCNPRRQPLPDDSVTARRYARLSPMQPVVVRLCGRRRRAERGVLFVSERRGSAAGREIKIPVLQVLSAQTTGDVPLFRLGGGPGMSNLRFGCPPALAARDIVLVGFRGVDGSARLDCPDHGGIPDKPAPAG